MFERSRRLLALAALLGVHTVASAQEPAPLRQAESIPYELASALVSSGGLGGDPQILIGEIPGWVLNRIVVPAGARVVGSAISGSNVVSILAYPPSADSALVDLKRELMKKGWLNPPPQPTYGGGFRSAQMIPASIGTPFRMTLCNDQQILTGTAARKRGMTMEVTLRIANGSQYSSCHPQQVNVQGMINNRPQNPLLYNPPGAQELGPTSSDCPDPRFAGAQTWTSFKASVTADALLEHYGKQLTDSGWKAAPGQPSVISRSFTRPDSTGAPVETSLIVTIPALQPGCRQVTMYTSPIKKP